MARLMTNPSPRGRKATPSTERSRPVVVFAVPSLERTQGTVDDDTPTPPEAEANDDAA